MGTKMLIEEKEDGTFFITVNDYIFATAKEIEMLILYVRDRFDHENFHKEKN